MLDCHFLDQLVNNVVSHSSYRSRSIIYSRNNYCLKHKYYVISAVFSQTQNRGEKRMSPPDLVSHRHFSRLTLFYFSFDELRERGTACSLSANHFPNRKWIVCKGGTVFSVAEYTCYKLAFFFLWKVAHFHTWIGQFRYIKIITWLRKGNKTK